MEDNNSPTSLALSPKDLAVMKELGITRVPVEQFHIGKYRYSTLDEAVAQAERQNRETTTQKATNLPSKGVEPAE